MAKGTAKLILEIIGMTLLASGMALGIYSYMTTPRREISWVGFPSPHLEILELGIFAFFVGLCDLAAGFTTEEKRLSERIPA